MSKQTVELTKIVGIKCGNKYYISRYSEGNYGGPFYALDKEFLINGEKARNTFHDNWSLVDDEPQLVQIYKSQPNINHRFELKDKSMKSKKTPLKFEREKVAKYKEYEWVWQGKYQMFQSLYQEVSDKQPNILTEVLFEYTTLMEVKEVKDFEGFTYDIQKTKYEKDGLTTLTENHVQHQLIDRIMFPNILLPTRPCKFNSEQTYKIIKQYIKQNMNYDVAEITSDYNFCFTVSKKIAFSEPEEYSVDINAAHPRRKSKWQKRYRTSRSSNIFSMAPAPYKGYKVIPGFEGKDQEDLKAKIDSYCKDLIEVINEPIKDCPHCKGRGVIETDVSPWPKG